MTEAGRADELMFGGALNEVDEPAVRCRQLRADLGQRQAPFLFRHAGVEGVDAPVPYGVPRWRAALEDERQVRQRLLFPRGHVREDIAYRPARREPRPEGDAEARARAATARARGHQPMKRPNESALAGRTSV